MIFKTVSFFLPLLVLKILNSGNKIKRSKRKLVNDYFGFLQLSLLLSQYKRIN